MDERVRKLLEQQREIDGKQRAPIKHEMLTDPENILFDRITNVEESIESLKTLIEVQKKDSTVNIFASNINALSSTCKSLNGQISDTNDELSALRDTLSLLTSSSDLFRETTTDKIDSNNRLLAKLKLSIEKNQSDLTTSNNYFTGLLQKIISEGNSSSSNLGGINDRLSSIEKLIKQVSENNDKQLKDNEIKQFKSNEILLSNFNEYQMDTSKSLENLLKRVDSNRVISESLSNRVEILESSDMQIKQMYESFLKRINDNESIVNQNNVTTQSLNNRIKTLETNDPKLKQLTDQLEQLKTKISKSERLYLDTFESMNNSSKKVNADNSMRISSNEELTNQHSDNLMEILLKLGDIDSNLDILNETKSSMAMYDFSEMDKTGKQNLNEISLLKKLLDSVRIKSESNEQSTSNNTESIKTLQKLLKDLKSDTDYNNSYTVNSLSSMASLITKNETLLNRITALEEKIKEDQINKDNLPNVVKSFQDATNRFLLIANTLEGKNKTYDRKFSEIENIISSNDSRFNETSESFSLLEKMVKDNNSNDLLLLKKIIEDNNTSERITTNSEIQKMINESIHSDSSINISTVQSMIDDSIHQSSGSFTILSGDNEVVKLTYSVDARIGKIITFPYSGPFPNKVKVMLNGSTEIPMSSTNGFLYSLSNGKINILCGSSSIGSTFDVRGNITNSESGRYDIFVY